MARTPEQQAAYAAGQAKMHENLAKRTREIVAIRDSHPGMNMKQAMLYKAAAPIPATWYIGGAIAVLAIIMLKRRGRKAKA